MKGGSSALVDRPASCKMAGILVFCVSLLMLEAVPVGAFSASLFQEVPTAQQIFPSKTDGVDIELPNFDELFGRIQQVSPLARVAVESNRQNGDSDAPPGAQGRGLVATTDHQSGYRWTTIESKPRGPVRSIEKIDNFQGLGAPILRFRSTLDGRCDGEAFANFIMELEERKKWDVQIENVYEAYPVHDLDSANIAMGFNYGDCLRLGVGYCKTKANFGIDAREQLTLCGINEFRDGSYMIWGTEMAEWHDHLFPRGERTTRAKSHIFSTTLVPTGPAKFDVEYVLQLEIGGKIPTWLTTPIVTDSVKRLFRCAHDFYLDKDGEFHRFLMTKRQSDARQGYSLLLTP